MAERKMTKQALLACFPRDQYPKVREQQERAFAIIAAEDGNVTLEAFTGSGKTAMGYTFARHLQLQHRKPLFIIAPTKTIVEQWRKLHPDLYDIYGRNEYSCLYYPEEDLNAEEVPCAFLRKCGHRVHKETGETYEAGAVPCPYLQRKYEAKQAGIVVSTMQFYLYTQLFSKEWARPAGLVIDEVHRIAETVRNALEYDITDYYLRRCEEVLMEVHEDSGHRLADFRRVVIRIVRSKPLYKPTLITQEEIKELMDILAGIDSAAVHQSIADAISSGKVDPVRDRKTLKYLDRFVHNLGRYLHSLGYSLQTANRAPLNYVYAFLTKQESEDEDSRNHRLVVKGYHVAPLIKKLLGERTLSMSATVGDPEVFAFETGITTPVHQLASDFLASKTRIFLPVDMPALNFTTQKGTHRTIAKAMRTMVRAARRFAENGHRSLVIVSSEEQRQRFIRFCREEDIHVVSYDEDTPPKDIALRFRDGEGIVLVGTSAQYSEGLDLPGGLASVIFFLKPDYPRPDDPAVQFEERRFSRSRRWGLQKWRVMIRALQVRGRNIRSRDDVGVTFFISRQFRDIVPAALPEWLWPALRSDLTMDQCVEETLNLLGRR